VVSGAVIDVLLAGIHASSLVARPVPGVHGEPKRCSLRILFVCKIRYQVHQEPGGRDRAVAEQKIGVVAHYFGKIEVAAIELTDGELRVGDTIRIKGHTSDFTETVDSIQLEHEAVESAAVGDSIGVKVSEHAREHDEVFKLLPD
jgi:hypothetical protein